MLELTDTQRHFRLIDVFEAGWKSCDAYVQPRPYNALSYRIRGSAVFGDGEREISLSDGAVMLMPAGTPYRLRSGEEKLIVVHFEVNEPVEPRFSSLDGEQTAAVRENFFAMLDIWRSKRAGYELFALSEWYRLLGQIGSLAEEPGRRGASRKIRPALQYIHEHFDDPALGVNELCRQTGLGETQLRKYFFSVCGMTPLRYINEYRIKHASSLMDSGLLSVQEAARMSGFADAKYFSTVFRKYRGMSPSEYRDRCGSSV